MAEQASSAKMKGVQSYFRAARQVQTAAPVFGLFAQFYYLLESVYPAIAMVLTVGLFDSVGNFLQGTANFAQAVRYGWLLAAAYAVYRLLEPVSSAAINAGVYEKGVMDARIRLAEKSARLSLTCYEDANLINLRQRAMQCVDREIHGQLYMNLNMLFTSTIGVISVSLALAKYSPLFLPISICSVIPYLVSYLIRGKEFTRARRQQAKKERRLQYLWSLFTGKETAREIRAMNFGEYVAEQWTACRDEVSEELWALGKKDSLSLLLCDFLQAVGYGASICLALFLAARGTVSIGVFGACLAAIRSVQTQMRYFLSEIGALPRLVSFAKDYYAFLDLPEDSSGELPFPGMKNEIKLENIYFSYPNAKEPALKGVNLTIRKGEKLALIGENGCGKTTLTKLLLGVYPASGGSVTIDGVPLASIHKDEFWKKVSIVSQDFVTYKLTLRENVGISDPERMGDDGEIRRALEQAALPQLAELSPDTQMGRDFDGLELSGGQWQKLAIARGLFRDSEIIVLDEPTSALDPKIESEILTEFMELAKDRTAVIISHRVGLCRAASRVAVMKDGRIAETGSHEELLKSRSLYRQMWEAQASWYVDSDEGEEDAGAD